MGRDCAPSLPASEFGFKVGENFCDEMFVEILALTIKTVGVLKET
jgi:hypothetical protein